MCAIIGCIANCEPGDSQGIHQAEDVVRTIFARSTERGRDGWGYRIEQGGTNHEEHHNSMFYPFSDDSFFQEPFAGTLIGNLRAEPTTEYVKEKRPSDQQPYTVNAWTIVHNGTIANDKELRTNALETSIDSAAIVELLDMLDPGASPEEQFAFAIRKLKGSYAILATHHDEPNVIFAACNYRPIWYVSDGAGTYFASSRSYFPDHMHPVMLPPYSVWRFDAGGGTRLDSVDAVQPSGQRALVVCSGGLDSVVAATMMVRAGYDVTLLHFRYGSRAEGPEVSAMWKVAKELGVGLGFSHLDEVWTERDSPLLQADSAIAGGEAGAEFAHEWVPARNLVMLAHATALAEAKGFDLIVLGNNLEEAGAYPDNEPEFINRFNDLLPFAVGDGKKISVVMPVGNLMKHEIVAMGIELKAPLHLTWSCYRAGELHCGTCGPCFMRRTAFDINKEPEVIRYANEGEQHAPRH